MWPGKKLELAYKGNLCFILNHLYICNISQEDINNSKTLKCHDYCQTDFEMQADMQGTQPRKISTMQLYQQISRLLTQQHREWTWQWALKPRHTHRHTTCFMSHNTAAEEERPCQRVVLERLIAGWGKLTHSPPSRHKESHQIQPGCILDRGHTEAKSICIAWRSPALLLLMN